MNLIRVRRTVSAVALAACAAVMIAGCSGDAGNEKPKDEETPSAAPDPTAEAECDKVTGMIATISDHPELLLGADIKRTGGSLDGSKLTCHFESSAPKEGAERLHPDLYAGSITVRGTVIEDGRPPAVFAVETDVTKERDKEYDKDATKVAKGIGEMLANLEPDQRPANAELLTKLAKTNDSLPDDYRIESYGADEIGAFYACVAHEETGYWAMYGTLDPSKPKILGTGDHTKQCMPGA